MALSAMLWTLRLEFLQLLSLRSSALPTERLNLSSIPLSAVEQHPFSNSYTISAEIAETS